LKRKKQTYFLTPIASKKSQISQICRQKSNLATLPAGGILTLTQ